MRSVFKSWIFAMLAGCLSFVFAGCRTPREEVGAEVAKAVSPERSRDDSEPNSRLEPRVDMTSTGASAASALDRRGSIEHVARGAKVTVSSTHMEWPGEGPAGALVDGDLTTRWSSEYSEPQFIIIDLGAPRVLDRILLHWEYAFATRYTVSVSSDGEEWALVHACMKALSSTNASTDTVELRKVGASQLRLDLEKRVNAEWGFSLYEVEVHTE